MPNAALLPLRSNTANMLCLKCLRHGQHFIRLEIKGARLSGFFALTLIYRMPLFRGDIVILNGVIEKINLSLDGEHATVMLTFISD